MVENLEFARSVDETNEDLVSRVAQVAALRAHRIPSILTTIGLEKRTNPFLRLYDPQIRSCLQMEDKEADGLSVFTELRRRKDTF